MIEITFDNSVKEVSAFGLTQWDKGQKLKILWDDMPLKFQVHFTSRGSHEAIVVSAESQSGTAVVDIPDELLKNSADIFAWIYLTEGENVGESTKRAVLYVRPRAKPHTDIEDLEPTQQEITEIERKIITDFSEEEIERIINQQDDRAKIVRRTGITTTRIFDDKIQNSLKKLYHYRCQVCGATATVMYGVDVSEAHHIDYFTKSANNNPGNIVILCPDHHRIVHKAKAVFNFELHQFEYENAKVDPLMFNLHL